MIILLFIIILIYICYKKKNNLIEYYEYICNLPKNININKWNTKINKIQQYNNCYAYAMRNLELNRNDKIQPGDLSNKKRILKKYYTCENFKKNIKSDYPDILDTNLNDMCPCNYYKIALFLDDTGNDKDYHFYRQDDNYTWSHKPGNMQARNTDESNIIITNPLTCDKQSKTNKDRHYNKFCGFFCAPYIKNNYLDIESI